LPIERKSRQNKYSDPWVHEGSRRRLKRPDCHSATMSHSVTIAHSDSVPGGPDTPSQMLHRSLALKRENSKRKAPYHDRKTADCSVRQNKKKAHIRNRTTGILNAPSEACLNERANFDTGRKAGSTCTSVESLSMPKVPFCTSSSFASSHKGFGQPNHRKLSIAR
jgi:hypothetical protein